MTFEIAVLDMAGTTVADDGLVESAFSRAVGTLGIQPADDQHATMLDYVRATMGESKIAVFRALLQDEAQAQEANAAFEAAYGDLIDDGFCTALPGAADAIDRLRTGGIKVALTTGFSRATLSRILRALEWEQVADLTLCPADVGRGRPYPDLALSALLALEGTEVRSLVTAGDTGYDMRMGRAAGAGLVAGVLTGAHESDQLLQAGADQVLDSISDLPGLVLNR
ncbi:phosphonatase-like hydrolase [Pengzhenrongella sicca]|uniref:Phosphonatase-like hydrolase n=1 Tax=Pengzhenrongella sicca TaxID=2819238 RepID=A0A8A4ZFM4_9MICO|nr:phosphonatase-like hydrolase [Pengzhenrongella sicca]QTE30095.1 phosphonatase-like hydrolase [Pengzhenrongella sicca]